MLRYSGECRCSFTMCRCNASNDPCYSSQTRLVGGTTLLKGEIGEIYGVTFYMSPLLPDFSPPPLKKKQPYYSEFNKGAYGHHRKKR